MKKFLFTPRVCPLVVLSTLLFCNIEKPCAQYYFYNDDYLSKDIIVEVGCSAGLMNSLTDLGGQKGIGKRFIKDLNWKVSQPSYSIYVIGTYRNAVGLRAEFTKGTILSADGLLQQTDPDLAGRYGRNLSFKTSITEYQLSTEVHPLFFKEYYTDEVPSFSPYLVTGIAYFSFDPRAELNGEWHALHALRLEGQGFEEYPDRKAYKLKQLNLPFGAGIKREISTVLSARLEIVYRKLFTDYLDDVSNAYVDPVYFSKYLSPQQAIIAKQLYSRMEELQPAYQVSSDMPRGNRKNKDAYFTIQVKVGIAIRYRGR